jgi:hypothetical protein
VPQARIDGAHDAGVVRRAVRTVGGASVRSALDRGRAAPARSTRAIPLPVAADGRAPERTVVQRSGAAPGRGRRSLMALTPEIPARRTGGVEGAVRTESHAGNRRSGGHLERRPGEAAERGGRAQDLIQGRRALVQGEACEALCNLTEACKRRVAPPSGGNRGGLCNGHGDSVQEREPDEDAHTGEDERRWLHTEARGKRERAGREDRGARTTEYSRPGWRR